MVAKGKDCSDLFPAVVKNVVSKNSEIKKLVYVYLVRYAEEQQDVALLSISTFQKALKDPNQLIRGSALRVLSSIRVPIIAPILMLSIKESVTDMSPYVRKTAANAIPKLYSLDPEHKDQLVEIIEKLLKDQTTLVAGSVVMAFETVCPERIDLVHKNYRKLCNLLVDVDEWGQVMIIHMLTRYARTQFLNPNQEELADAPFYSDNEESEEESSDDEDEEDEVKEKKKKKKPAKKKPYVMDSDHRLLLRNAKPLLQSRNAAVVMAVAQLYHHIAPHNELTIVTKPLIRLLKSHSEVQSIVLSNMATISAERPGMFEPYLKSFFVHSSDPTNIKLLKLDIIANVAGDTSIHTILREFRTYIASSDKEFAASTIQAIGRVACSISTVTETCLHGLMSLLNHKNESVVGESVVVIKKLLQLHPKENKDLIVQVAKLTDSVTVPMAKASVLWLVGEYCSLVPKIAPDVLRKAAKSFPDEEDIVKLQTVNLAAKLCIANAKQSKLLCQYVLNLAKYDLNYDIRDRARFLQRLVLPRNETALSKYAKKILLASKPAPVLESLYKGRGQWQLGSLTHAINAEAAGYIPLSDFPQTAPDPSVRDVEDNAWGFTPNSKKKKKEKGFYDDDKSSSEGSSSGSDFYSSISGSDESGSEDSESDSEESESGSGSGSEEEESESGDESSSDEGDTLRNLQKRFGVSAKKKGVSESEETSSEEESSEEESESGEEESSEEEDSPVKAKPQAAAASKASKDKQAKKKAAEDDPLRVDTKDSSLLDLDDWEAPVSSSTQGASAAMTTADLLTPVSTGLEGLSLSDSKPASTSSFQIVEPTIVPKSTSELLNRMKGEGLQVNYRFTRRPHISSAKLVGVEITAQNTLDTPLGGVSVGETRLQSGMVLKETGGLSSLPGGATSSFTIGIDFNDTQQPAKFDICVGQGKKFAVQIEPVVGELLRPIFISEQGFLALQEKLRGMHENSGKIVGTCKDAASAKTAVLETTNVAQVSTADQEVLRFAGITFSTGLPVLVTVQLGSKVVVNSEKMVINSMLMKAILKAVTT